MKRQRVLKIGFSKKERNIIIFSAALFIAMLFSVSASAASVNVTSPLTGANVSGSITLNATVYNLTNITSVAFTWFDNSGNVSNTTSITNVSVN